MTNFYSIRMRASSGAKGAHRHISGGERLVPESEAEGASAALIARALSHGADSDHINVTFERVPANHLRTVPCLPVTNVDVDSALAARPVAEQLLRDAGIGQAAIDVAFTHVLHGIAGSPLRGAILINAHNGDRLDDKGESGVRASHFDFAPGALAAAKTSLAAAGLVHHRTHEALALATKVLAAGVAAELCWSDDADYDAGYVSTLSRGYVRFPHFKPRGAVGGRVFFYDGVPNLVGACIHRLKSACVLIDGNVIVTQGVESAQMPHGAGK